MDGQDIMWAVQIAQTVGIAAFGWLLFVLKDATAKAVVAKFTTRMEEIEKAAAKAQDWPNELARILEKSRGVERQERRYESYGRLWEQLRPLAIYDATPFGRENAHKLGESLSDWYFSAGGGLLLTPQARDFYFALQNLLQIVSRGDDWIATRSPDATPESEQALLKALIEEVLPGDDDLRETLSYFAGNRFTDWEVQGVVYGKKWKTGLQTLAHKWESIDSPYRRFLVLQQAGSKLRSTLSIDLESRMQ